MVHARECLWAVGPRSLRAPGLDMTVVHGCVHAHQAIFDDATQTFNFDHSIVNGILAIFAGTRGPAQQYYSSALQHWPLRRQRHNVHACALYDSLVLW